METNYNEIKYLDKKETISQYLSESKNQFEQRLEYIKKLEKANINWKEANRLSKIWYCIKFKHCKYTPEVYYKVISYENNKLS